jgi:hypothetical protein
MNTAARYADVATASTPTRIETGPVQLEKRPPAALPTGTRRAAIAPTIAPSANGVRIEEIEKTVSIERCWRPGAVPARMA